MASLINSSVEPPLASPKTNNEANIANGTTALLNAANTPTFVWVPPLFQKKNPSPEAIKPMYIKTNHCIGVASKGMGDCPEINRVATVVKIAAPRYKKNQILSCH